VIFDIGANVGNHAVYWAVNLKPVRIYAFEPVPATFQVLQRNIEINHLQSCIVAINAAVGDVKETLSIERYSLQNIGGTSLRKDPSGRIPAVRLDDFEFPEGRVDFVKIDVEGFERHVVTGAHRFLEGYHPRHIFVEVWLPGPQKWMSATLRTAGYRLVWRSGHNFLYQWERIDNDTETSGTHKRSGGCELWIFWAESFRRPIETDVDNDRPQSSSFLAHSIAPRSHWGKSRDRWLLL
jgi:FkbM family methyltransferase